MQTPLQVLEKTRSISLPVAPDSSVRRLAGTQPTSYRLRPHAELFRDREVGVPLTPQGDHGQVLLASCVAHLCRRASIGGALPDRFASTFPATSARACTCDCWTSRSTASARLLIK